MISITDTQYREVLVFKDYKLTKPLEIVLLGEQGDYQASHTLPTKNGKGQKIMGKGKEENEAITNCLDNLVSHYEQIKNAYVEDYTCDRYCQLMYFKAILND